MGDVLGSDEPFAERLVESPAHRIGAVALEQLVELVDVAHPLLGSPMSELGQVGESPTSDLEEVLTLEVALGALA